MWVPNTWRVEWWKRGAVDRSYDYALKWRSVNEPPSSDLFEVESLNAAKGTLVTNFVGQQPFIERVIGEPDSVVKGTVLSSRQGVRRVAWTAAQIALIAANVVVALGLLALIVLRRRRSKHSL